MIKIRPVFDLRYKFTKIESALQEGEPVYLTKYGYGTMVVLRLETYSKLTDYTENALNAADRYAAASKERLSPARSV